MVPYSNVVAFVETNFGLIMNKSTIIDEMLKSDGIAKLKMKKKDLSLVYDTFVNTLCDFLSKDEKVRIYGLGTLYKVSFDEKSYRNPKTGQVVTSPKRKRIRFRPSANLLELINS